jgi:hypothetical protein
VQGKEFPITVLLTTRGGVSEKDLVVQSKKLGFLQNENRLNVAMSRSQQKRIVLGNSAMLFKFGGILWKQFLLQHAAKKAILPADQFIQGWKSSPSNHKQRRRDSRRHKARKTKDYQASQHDVDREEGEISDN